MASSPDALWIKDLIYENIACAKTTKDNNLYTNIGSYLVSTLYMHTSGLVEPYMLVLPLGLKGLNHWNCLLRKLPK